VSERNLHSFHVPLSALECFVETAAAESWSGAAVNFTVRNVNLDRHAVRRQVGALEGYLDVKLFRRTKHSIHLTPAGEYYLPEAQSILDAAASARHNVQLINPPKWEKLALGYAPSPTVEFREPAIDRFERTHKRISIVSSDLSADACKKEVAAGRLLVALLPQPLRLPPGLAFKRLIDYPICCVVSARDERFATLKCISVSQVGKERWLLLNRKEFTQYEEHVRNMLSLHFTPLFAPNEYDGSESMLSGAYHKHGLALLLSTVSSLSEHLKISVNVLPFDPPLARIEVGAVFREPPLKIVQDCLDAARSSVRSISLVNGVTPLEGRVLC
jgi:DNA-binding transcriptional LysR family regulator